MLCPGGRSAGIPEHLASPASVHKHLRPEGARWPLHHQTGRPMDTKHQELLVCGFGGGASAQTETQRDTLSWQWLWYRGCDRAVGDSQKEAGAPRRDA